MAETATEEKFKKYSLEDIALHNNQNSAWLLIHGNVYDVTPFLEEHPGGEEILLEHAGKHATESFEDIGHSTDARDYMKTFKIGELCDEDLAKIEDASIKDMWRDTQDDSSSWRSWLVPVVVAVLASMAYRFYLGLNA